MRSIQRRPFHTILTLSTVVIAVTALFTSLWLGKGLERGLKLGMEKLGADILVLPREAEAKPEQVLFTGFPLNIYMDRSLLYDIRKIPGVKQATPELFTRTSDAMCCNLESAGRVVGIDFETDFVVKPWMKNVPETLGKDKAIVGNKIDARADEFILIRGQLFRVVDQLPPTGTGIDDVAYISIEVAARIAKESPDLAEYWTEKSPDQLVSSILVRVDDPNSINAIVDKISKLEGANAIPASQIVYETKQRMSTFTGLLYTLTAVLWLVSLVSLIGRFAGLVIERKTEIGILRALGAMRWSVFRLILWEAGCLAIASSLIGLGLGWFVSRFAVGWVTSGSAVPFLSLPISQIAILSLWCLLAAVGTVLISALFPAYYSASLDPARAIAQGELE